MPLVCLLRSTSVTISNPRITQMGDQLSRDNYKFVFNIKQIFI
jgi:hypothetical protein